MPTDKRPLKVFLCHARRDREAVEALEGRVGGALPPLSRPCPSHQRRRGLLCPLGYAWLDKEKLHGSPRRTILPGQDWELELEIRKDARERV